jgi:hypothetical protein
MTTSEPCRVCGRRHRTLTSEQCLDRQMTEKTLQTRVVGRAKRRGWRTMHVAPGIATFDSTGEPIYLTAADAGWPDITLAKPGHRLIFFEFKREQGEVTDVQLEWLQLLNQTGNFAVVVRPSHLRTGAVGEILKTGAPV